MGLISLISHYFTNCIVPNLLPLKLADHCFPNVIQSIHKRTPMSFSADSMALRCKGHGKMCVAVCACACVDVRAMRNVVQLFF